jgi:hypothetical protein
VGGFRFVLGNNDLVVADRLGILVIKIEIEREHTQW